MIADFQKFWGKELTEVFVVIEFPYSSSGRKTEMQNAVPIVKYIYTACLAVDFILAQQCDISTEKSIRLSITVWEFPWICFYGNQLARVYYSCKTVTIYIF